ncbi:transcription factor ILI6 isoform X2 [Brachypodium distachyon]|nr:transcription factor ILI6 isoform X2 [Brachypodium distachyon]XP_014752676.1 transcription factor ILI6 isoform X2 [Brachypodium distachyon]XP_024313619.1 transcription factor ILI6 isoform X2 [Brachypodium distachyon]|eukprot:XP_014752670.1 transcription factor ILI6 isoform X2 [Brachypodium distachyon]
MHALLASKSSVSPAFLLLFKASSPLAGPMHEQHNTQHKRLNLTYLYLGSSTAALTLSEMSSRRSRSRQSGSSRITDEQISDLVSKLQDLLPEARLRSNDRVPSSRVLQETCSYIRSLHREVDDLSERLSELLATSDMSSAQAAIIRSLLM